MNRDSEKTGPALPMSYAEGASRMLSQEDDEDIDTLYSTMDHPTPDGDEETIIINASSNQNIVNNNNSNPPSNPLLPQSDTNPADTLAANAANSAPNSMPNISNADFQEFLKWKAMQSQQQQQQQGNPTLSAKPSLQPRASNPTAVATLVMNEKEQAKYKEFLKEKKTCYKRFDTTSNYGNLSSAGSDGTTDIGISQQEQQDDEKQIEKTIMHPFGTQFNDMHQTLNAIFEQAAKNYGKILQIFEETDEKCHKQWKIATIDEKENDSTTPGGDPFDGKDIDTVSLMQYNINFFRTYTNKVEQFKRNLALNFNTFRGTLKQFDNEMINEESNINSFSYENWLKNMRTNFGSIEAPEVEYILPPGTPTGYGGGPNMGSPMSSGNPNLRFQSMESGANTPPPQYLNMNLEPGTPRGPTPGRFGSGHVDVTNLPAPRGRSTVEPPSVVVSGYGSDGTVEHSHMSDYNVMHMRHDTYDNQPTRNNTVITDNHSYMSPGSRVSAIAEIEEKKEEELPPRQLGFITSSHFSAVHFKDNNVNSGRIVCNYKIKSSDHAGTTVIFTPSLNSMFKGTNKNKHGQQDSFEQSISGTGGPASTLSGHSGTGTRMTFNDSNTSGGIIGGAPARTEIMEVTLTKCHCNNQVLLNGGYNFQIGVVVVPRDVPILQMQNKFEQIKLKNPNCYLHNLKDKDRLFGNFQTYYMSFTYFTTGTNAYRCCFGKNEFRDYVSLYYNGTEYKPNYCFKKGDSVKIQIEQNHLRSHYLSFIKNGEIVGFKKTDKEFKQGRIKLNFSKNRYLFALSSIRCDCRTTLIKKRKFEGFEFEVNIEGKTES